MIRYERPAEPSGFAADAKVHQQMLERAVNPRDGSVRDVAAWRALKLNPLWGLHKDAFNGAQYAKCGYCERQITSDGDVEHFKPKKMVARVDQPGIEKATLRVSGRTARDKVEPGYWWLAYDWNNYLFACAHCNRRWKKSFVVADPPHTRSDVPSQGRQEDFVVLHPYDDDPEEHLAVDEQGSMRPLTGRGRHSIAVLGLNRPSLLPARSDAYRNSRSLAQDALGMTNRLPELIGALHPRFPFGAARRSGAAAGIGGSDPMRFVMELVGDALCCP